MTMGSRYTFAWLLFVASWIKLSLQYDILGTWSYVPNKFKASVEQPCGLPDTELCGPNNWGYISPTCSNEGTQSPINFGLAPLIPTNTFGSVQIPKDTQGCKVVQQLETRSSFQVSFIDQNNASCGNLYIIWNGKKYYLKQFHLHSPSEHSYGSGYYDAEVHLVHQGSSEDFLVLAIFLEASSTVLENQFLAPFWARGFTPNATFEDFSDKPVNPYVDFLPPVHSYLKYDGSLTVPPCTTPVTFLLFTQPLFTTREEINTMRETLIDSKQSILSESGGSNRPVQALGSRVVYYYDPATDTSAAKAKSFSLISLVLGAVALAVAIGALVCGTLLMMKFYRTMAAQLKGGHDLEEAKGPLMTTELPPFKASRGPFKGSHGP